LLKKRAFIFIILAGALWGSIGLFIHVMIPYGLSPAQMTCVVSFVAASVMFLYFLCCRRELFKITIRELLLFLGSGAALFFTATCNNYSLQLTSVSTAVVLMYTAPVMVMAYSVAFLGEKLTGTKLLALVSMIAGCCFVTGVLRGFSFNLYGILMGLASGIAFSAYNIFTKIQMKNKCNPVSATFYCFVFMFVISLCLSNPGEVVQIAIHKPGLLLIAIVCGVCTRILPYVLYAIALKVLPVGTASALAVVEPMTATILSVIFLHETLHLDSILGIILVIGSVLLLSRAER